MERFSDDDATGDFIFIQAKGTADGFSTNKDGDVILKGFPIKTIRYALLFDIPFFVFFTSIKDKITVFLHLQAYARKLIKSGKLENKISLTLSFPKENIIPDNLDKVVAIIEGEKLNKIALEFLVLFENVSFHDMLFNFSGKNYEDEDEFIGQNELIDEDESESESESESYVKEIINFCIHSIHLNLNKKISGKNKKILMESIYKDYKEKFLPQEDGSFDMDLYEEVMDLEEPEDDIFNASNSLHFIVDHLKVISLRPEFFALFEKLNIDSNDLELEIKQVIEEYKKSSHVEPDLIKNVLKKLHEAKKSILKNFYKHNDYAALMSSRV